MNNKSLKVKKAFTLIEVIIAVSIVVILASLAVPKVSGYIGKARDAKILNTGKQIYTAAMWSYSDQGNAFNASKVSEAINTAVGISGITASSISINATSGDVTITFSTDNNTCTVVIDDSDSSYKVNKGSNEIFASKN
jgi:type IV pilus assembly protein PilA